MFHTPAHKVANSNVAIAARAAEVLPAGKFSDPSLFAVTGTISIEELQDLHHKLRPDSTWFSLSAMKFFDTKLPDFAYVTKNGHYFVTREANHANVSRYSLRLMGVDGHIRTVGDFHEHNTQGQALKAMYKHLGVVS